MGIRFFCPNGHKLNVKEHLAGKTGYCPDCGVRLVIPFESTRKSSKELREEALRQKATGKSLSPHAEDSDLILGVRTPELQVAAVQAEVPAAAQVAETPFTASQSEDAPANPVLQDKTVVWYVQVPGGPQYGPASDSVIHSWIQQRRISPDMLVWREGWESWLEAKNVFPELE